MKTLRKGIIARYVLTTPGGSAAVELGRLSSIIRVLTLRRLIGLRFALLPSSPLTGLEDAKKGQKSTQRPLLGLLLCTQN